jgi:hypothetical protein
VSLDLQQCEWCDWLQDEICSLPFDERVMIMMAALDHSSSLSSLLMLRDLSTQQRFKLASTLRDAAMNLERAIPGVDAH